MLTIGSGLSWTVTTPYITSKTMQATIVENKNIDYHMLYAPPEKTWDDAFDIQTADMDEYRLIPNGKEVRIPSDGLVNAYIVEEVYSGQTISWMGASSEHYRDSEEYLYEMDYEKFELFEEFFSWAKDQRNSWKKRQLKKLQQNPAYSLDANIPVKENNMQYSTYNNAAVATVVAAETDEAKQRKYLTRRLDDIADQKRGDLYVFFKLDPVASPRTFTEFVDKIKSGDITYEGKDKDMKHWSMYSLLDSIRWSKDPADHEGYNAATKKLSDERTKVQDTISILSPEEGLKALQAFEAKKFH